MKAAYLWSLVLLLALAGCGGDASDGPEADSGPAGVDEEFTKQWGPDTMPDPDNEPLQLLYWRVDQMFDNNDTDGDGRITMDEFGGQAFNFERIDADADGAITKQEVIDDQLPRLREEGKIP